MTKSKHKILQPHPPAEDPRALPTEHQPSLPSDPAYPDPSQIGDLLHSAAIHLLRRLRVRDLATGVGPAQLSALSVLVFAGPRTLGELAQAEQVRPPTMSRIVASLERSRLVRRSPTPDKRRFLLEPTAKGTRILQEGRRRRVEALAQALQSLSPEDLRQAAHAAHFLRSLVRKL